MSIPIQQQSSKTAVNGSHIIGCSALLTTSPPYLRELVSTIEARGLWDKYKVMVRGAAVTEAFATAIGADGSARTSVGAVHLEKRMMGQH